MESVSRMESVYFKVVVIKTYVVLCRVKSCGVENVSIFATCHDMSALKWQKCPIFGFATKTCQKCLTCPLFSVSITPALRWLELELRVGFVACNFALRKTTRCCLGTVISKVFHHKKTHILWVVRTR
jgi:hypothetical protein